jgi:hypothetical protein
MPRQISYILHLTNINIKIFDCSRGKFNQIIPHPDEHRECIWGFCKLNLVIVGFLGSSPYKIMIEAIPKMLVMLKLVKSHTKNNNFLATGYARDRGLNNTNPICANLNDVTNKSISHQEMN